MRRALPSFSRSWDAMANRWAARWTCPMSPRVAASSAFFLTQRTAAETKLKPPPCPADVGNVSADGILIDLQQLAALLLLVKAGSRRPCPTPWQGGDKLRPTRSGPGQEHRRARRLST